MTQSVELLLDPAAEALIRDQWRALSEAGLPSERRDPPADHHRPHVTLLALPAITAEADAALPELVAGLDLFVVIGALELFGPGRRRGKARTSTYVLVRSVVLTPELTALQHRLAERCGADASDHFGPGRWSPHVTLARRIASAQIGAALDLLAGEPSEVTAHLTACRRWDGDTRTEWRIT